MFICKICNKEYKTQAALNSHTGWHTHKNRPSNLGDYIKKEHKGKNQYNNPDYIISDETRKKISIALKGRIISDETRKKLSISLKGKTYKKKRTEEHSRKISEALKGKKFTDAHRKNMTGYTMSDETKKKISNALIGRKDLRDRAILRMSNNNHNFTPSKSETRFLDLLEIIYNIKFERQYPLLLDDMGFSYDGRYKNILIEIDGKYWHNKPHQIRNDELKSFVAIDNDFILLRININSIKQVEETILGCGILLDKYFLQ